MDAPRIQHPQRQRSPALRLRSGPIAHDRYRIRYEFEGDIQGEIVRPTQDEAWALWRVVLAAHERSLAA